MDKIITTRVPEDFLEELRKISEKENIDVSTLIRKLLLKSMEEWRLNTCIEKIKNHKISIGKAAELCKVSIWELLEILKENSVDWVDYSEDDLKSDLKFIKSFK